MLTERAPAIMRATFWARKFLMRSWRTECFVVGFMIIALQDRAAADESLDSLMQSMANRHHGRAAFTERQFIALLKAPVDSSGDLYFRAPDHLEKITRVPVQESLVIERDTLTVTRGATHHSLPLRAYPQFGAFIDSIRATLAGDRSALEKTYALTFASEGNRWSLLLTPRDKKVGNVVRQIHIAGEGDSIDVVETVRPDGDRSVMTITELPDT